MPPKYFLPALVQNPLKRLWLTRIQKRQPLPEAPRAVQIQTVSGCNASCIFCPNKKTEREIPVGRRMDWDLYRSIIDQCLDLGVRRISPYLMNEPLLDTELPQRIRYITDRKKPEQYTKINSHGGLLTERMAKGLLDSGLDRLNFSVQGLDPEDYRRIMRLDLTHTIHNIERFMRLKEEGGYSMRVRVVLLDTRDIHPRLPEIRRFWGERGVKINVNQLENRGRHKGIQSDSIAVRPLQNFDWCNRMFEQVYILYDGRPVLCCADWEQTTPMGDLTTASLRDIWHNETYSTLRRRFLAGDVEGMLCNGCTKDAVGPEHDE